MKKIRRLMITALVSFIYISVNAQTVSLSITATTATSPTKLKPFQVKFEFGEKVSGFASSDVTLTNCSISTPTTADSTNFFTNVTPTTDGNVELSVSSGACKDFDTKGKNNDAANFSITYDGTAPNGYTVSVDQSYINLSNLAALSFTFASAEVGTTYNYSITSSGGGAAVTGSGTIDVGNKNISGVDVTGLNDGTLTLTVNLTDAAGNVGSDATSTVPKDATKPTGYTVAIDQSIINLSNLTALSFTFASAEIGTTYNYSITSSGGGTAVTGSGTIDVANKNILGVDVTGLNDGTLTLTVNLTDAAGNVGSDVTTTVTKDVVIPSGYSVAIDQTIINLSNQTALSFTFTGAEVGATYSYSIISSGGGTAVTGSGTINIANKQVTGINVAGLNDGTLTLSVKLTDAAGNDGVLTTSTKSKDATRPTVSIGAPNYTYTNSSRTVNFPITYTGADDFVNLQPAKVTINRTGATGGTVSVINGNTATPTVQVTGLAGTGSYTITIQSNTSSDAAGNTDNGAGPSASVVVDNTNPGYSSTTNPTSGTIYTLGEPLDIIINLSEVVIVDTTVNKPYIVINLDEGGAKNVYFKSGSGTQNLVFQYKIVLGDKDVNGTLVISNDVNLNGGTIKDRAGNPFSGTANISNATGLLINAARPKVNAVHVPLNTTYVENGVLEFTVEYDKSVDVEDGGGGNNRPYIEITIGSSVKRAYYNRGTGTTNIVFRYVVVANDLDLNGISVGTAIIKNSGDLLDHSNNNIYADTNLFGIESTTGVLVDAKPPFINTKTVPAGTYITGNTIAISINADGNDYVADGGVVIVNGEPSTFVNMGGGNYKIFYTVQSSNTNLNGVTTIASGDLNLKDNAGNKTQVFPVDVVGGPLTINTKPTVRITGSVTKCNDGTTTPITFTFANGQKPYDLTYNKNGVPQPAVLDINADTYTINEASGTFTLNSLVDNAGSTVNTALENATITLNPLPTLTFTPRALPYSKNDSRDTLSKYVSPMGGTFLGDAVVSGLYFYPTLVDPVNYDKDIPINYTYTNPGTGCTNTGSFNVQVSSTQGFIDGVQALPYCKNKWTKPDTCMAKGVLGTIISDFYDIYPYTPGWYTQGVPGSQKLILDPFNMNPGTYKITYYYYDASIGYWKWNIEKSFTVQQVGNVTLSNIASKYCTNDGVVFLIADNLTPAAGTCYFTGSATGFTSNSNVATLSPSTAPLNDSISISFHYVSGAGCSSDTIYRKTIVYSAPLADFTILKNNYNYNEMPVELVGTPTSSQSQFLGPIIEGRSTLNPKKADGTNIGKDIVITYKYVDDVTGCTSTKDQTTTVYNANELIKVVKADASKENLMDSYCFKDTVLTISCTPTIKSVTYPGIFTSSKGAVTYLTDNTASYNLNIAGQGDGIDTLTFNYKVGPIGDETDYQIVKRVIVDNVGPISLSIIDNSRYCMNKDAIPVIGIHPQHTDGISTYAYSGTLGAFDYLLGIPSLIPANEPIAGSHTIKYTYTSKINSSCSKSETKTIWIDPIPKVQFTVKKECNDGVGQPIDFTNTSISQGSTINSWTWSWGDGYTSTDEHPLTHTYSITGPKTVTLTAETDRGCTVVSSKEEINISVGPIADFKWDNDCKSGTPVNFTSISQNGPFSEWVWRLNGDSISNAESVPISLPELGKYSVSLVAKRTDNCGDTITKVIVVQPNIVLNPSSFYFETFDSDSLNWYPKNNTKSSWKYGIPSGEVFDFTTSESKAWYTKIGLNTKRKENAQIVSPCFDFTGLTKPMIKLRILSAPEAGRDGAVLQYSTDGGQTWNKNNIIGESGQGINWYDPGNLSSAPAGQSSGWSNAPASGWNPPTVVPQWRDARFNLENLKNESKVRFRIIYACDSTNNKIFNGFAFENVWIGDRQQNLLGEYFTNISSTTDNSYLKTFEKKKKDDIIPIHYHNNDALYDEYTEGPSSRKFYYGIGQIPSIYANGTIYSNLTDKSSFEIKADAATLMDPEISIEKVEVQNMEVKMVLKALTDLLNENLVLYCALVKDSIQINGTGDYYYNVLRRFIPSPGGISLPVGTWPAEGISQTISLNSITNAGEFINAKLVLFVQNSKTNEILQVVSSPAILATGNKPMDLSNLVDIYPIPARDYLIIECEHSIDRLMVFDLAGRVVGSYIPGQAKYSLPVQNLHGGIYILKGITKQGEFIRKFVKQ